MLRQWVSGRISVERDGAGTALRLVRPTICEPIQRYRVCNDTPTGVLCFSMPHVSANAGAGNDACTNEFCKSANSRCASSIPTRNE